MKKILISALLVAVGFSGTTNANELDKLLQQVKNNRISEAKINQQREAEFNSARADKQALLAKAKRDLANEEARGKRLQKQFADNEIRLANKETELKNAVGTLGEMFGVVRQNAAEAYGRISSSIISAEYPGRGELLEKMSNEAKGLPNIKELEELWFALQTEMTESAKVSRFDVNVNNLDGSSGVRPVVRAGTFNLIGEEGYLQYNAETQQVQQLGRQPDGHIVSASQNFFEANGSVEPFFVDPSKGQILGLLTAKATMEERYHQGGPVGYAITVLLLIGFLIAIERLVVLTGVGAKMKAQLKNPDSPSEGNPLGRILKVYHENKSTDVENLELKLDEAILRETPRIERGINLIKIFAAIAPLMGLLGTVIGMIGTFQSITLFGTGDPKIMAGDISMALVTTAMGLIAALPLIVVHSIVAGKSKSIVHVLDEQSAGIVAAHAEKG